MSKVLVAEDNVALAGVVRFNLERAGHDVTVAYDGLKAWEHAQLDTYDVVVTDQQMPEMTGCEFAHTLRGTDCYRSTPIIMLTAKGLELELPKLRDELGINATFQKPFSPKEVLAVVEDCLTASRTESK